MIQKIRAWGKDFKGMVQIDALVYDGQIIKASYKNGNVVKEELKNHVLMQSTGLIDKNGKEIFEGDILSVEFDEENAKVVVSLDSKHALFVVESKKYNEKAPLSELFEDDYYSVEIIGNIYENPELLEVEQ